MSDEPDAESPEEPSADLVEMLAKRLFRAENPDQTVWDTRAVERSGTPLDAVTVASEAVKDDYRTRAHQLLLDGGTGDGVAP